MFTVRDEIKPVRNNGRTLWVWVLTYSPAAPGVEFFEVRGVATSLDAATAEMGWHETLTNAKLRSIGIAQKDE